MGRAWVGDGATVRSDGKTMISRDGLRQYRPPSYKPRLGRFQANLEARNEPLAWSRPNSLAGAPVIVLTHRSSESRPSRM